MSGLYLLKTNNINSVEVTIYTHQGKYLDYRNRNSEQLQISQYSNGLNKLPFFSHFFVKNNFT